MTPAQARAQLDQFEARLRKAPHEILGIDRGADTIDACVAFTAAARLCHPRHFAGHDVEIVHRATLAYGRLRHALTRFVERERETRVTRSFHPDLLRRLPQR